MKNKRILVLLMTCLLGGPVSAEPPTLEVELSLSAEEDFGQALTACLTERIERFPGVEIRPKADVQLRLIALEQRSTEGDPFGYLFYQAGLVASEDPKARSVLWETLKSVAPDLPAACDRLASDYESNVIDPVREGKGMLLENIRSRLKSVSGDPDEP